MYDPKKEKKFLQHFGKMFPPSDPTVPAHTHKVTAKMWRYGDKEVTYTTPVGSFTFPIDFSSDIIRALHGDLYHLTIEADPAAHVGHVPPALLLWNNCYKVAHTPTNFVPPFAAVTR